MTDETNKILSDLYLDNITIEEACKLLNKTRREIWDLLDDFDYIPTSEDVIIACEIEQESMKIIENRAKRKISDYKSSDISSDADMLTKITKTILEPLKLKKFSKPS